VNRLCKLQRKMAGRSECDISNKRGVKTDDCSYVTAQGITTVPGWTGYSMKRESSEYVPR
jgi:hypothetical protein